MFRTTFITSILILGFFATCFSQFYPTQYRPPNQQWKNLHTPHFKLVYAGGNDSLALKMGQLLEQHYPSVQQMVGGNLQNFPIILNDYNDRSNGFVTPLHFRSEIELPPIIGKSLNPQTGNWLANVGPHELVHALQMSNLGENNISQLVGLFSPDLARGIHGAIPAGMLEGIAVHYESHEVTSNGGRGNFPIFTNQFNAIYQSGKRWSMGQMMHISSNTRPFNRHYIGGYKFTSWLQQRYGPSTTREALGFYMDYPFLGYGIALRHVTGKWPSQLYRQFKTDYESATKEGYSLTDTETLEIPFKGREVRRPKWLSENKLIFYGTFYNARPGFYSYNLVNDTINKIITTGSVGDYQYDLSQDRSEMVFSYFKADPIYDNTSKAELVHHNFSTDEQKHVTDGGRVYAPRYDGEFILALQSLPAASQIVELSTNKETPSIETILSLDNAEIVALDWQQSSQLVAVVANHEGNHGLWISSRKKLTDDLHEKPDILFKDGSIFDPEWHPGGDRLLFSSDFSGTHQLYEYHLINNTVTRITHAPYNAFEGSYSPDGSQIAFIKQVENERLPGIINRADVATENVSEHLVKAPDFWGTSPSITDSITTASAYWASDTYSSDINWLKPRTLLPVANEVSNSSDYQFGIGFHSNNLLQTQSYSTELSYFQNRFWYDIIYQNKTFYPGFKAQLTNVPSYLTFSSAAQNETASYTLLRQNRSLSLSVPLQVKLNQNIYSTSFYLEPEIRQSQMRFFEIGGSSGRSAFTNATSANIYGQFSYRLQQNSRDIQPNTGAIFFSEVEHYLNAQELHFRAYNNDVTYALQQATGIQAGIYQYVSPFRRWNQSLRLRLHGMTQSQLIFDNQSIVSEGFSEPIFTGSRNLLSFNTRYTIPLSYVDNGGFLLPLYLSHIYLVAFSNTVTDPKTNNWYDQSRTVFGLELRTRFRVSNLSLDIGVGVGYEPTRRNHQFFIDF